MIQETTIEDLKGTLEISLGDPLFMLLDWLRARFKFEGADVTHWFFPDIGAFKKLTMVFFIPEQIVVDETEVNNRLKQYLYHLEDPTCDAYVVFAPRLMYFIIVWDNGTENSSSTVS